MKPLILTALIASVCCIVISIHGQTSSENSGASQAKASNPQSSKIDTVNVPTVTVTKLPIQQQTEPAGKSNTNSKDSPSYFRRLFAPENLPNLILCVIGIVGVISAVCTLNVIRRQTHWVKKQTGILVQYNKATRDSADATVKSAEAMQNTVGLLGKQVDLMEKQLEEMQTSTAAAINKERGRIRVDVVHPDIREGVETYVMCWLTNFGATKVFVDNFSGRFIKTEDVSIVPDYARCTPVIQGESIERDDRSVASNTVWLEPMPKLTVDDVSSIRNQKQFLHFYGFVRFHDIFGASDG